jgi:hypothetical protein
LDPSWKIISALSEIAIDSRRYSISLIELLERSYMLGDFGAFRFDFTFGNRWFRVVSFIRVLVDALFIVINFQFPPLSAGLDVVRLQWFSFGLTSLGIFEEVQFYRETSIRELRSTLPFDTPFSWFLNTVR